MLKRLRSECLIDLDIVTEGPLLIKSGRMFATGVDMTAVRTIRNGREEVYIPGSSLKGAIRAQAERIARTLADPGCCDPFRDLSEYSRRDGASCSSFLKSLRDTRGLDALPAEEVYQKSCPICKLFGSLWQAGRLAFNDAHVQGINPRVYERSNVGIDRRTGGASPGALFEMEVVPPTTRFHTSLYLRNFELWQLGLLAFVLRDLEEGLIKLGMGKSRGLGQVRAEVGNIEIRYLGLQPPPTEGALCQLHGMRSLEPETAYGFAAYGTSEAGQHAAATEARAVPLYGSPAPNDGVRASTDGYGLRTIYRFAKDNPAQRQHLQSTVAPLWVMYARYHPYSMESAT